MKTKMQTKLGKFTVHYRDLKEFHSVKREIFAEGVYELEIDKPDPVIIDAGAHIGLATLFFLSRFPLAQVIAIEPHPANFELLDQNIWQNRLENQVITVQTALSSQGGPLTLHADPTQEWLSTASVRPGAWTGDQETEPIEVPTNPLSEFLDQPVDLLKLDVEGAELDVLQSAGDLLKNVKTIIMEHHPTTYAVEKQLTELLEKHGFSVIKDRPRGLQIFLAKNQKL